MGFQYLAEISILFEVIWYYHSPGQGRRIWKRIEF